GGYGPTAVDVVGRNPRLCGAGIFHDPADLCVLLVVGALFGLYQLTNRRRGSLRFIWLLPLGVIVAGIPLTGSRGGMLAMLAGLGTLALTRLGVRRGLILGGLLLPVLLVAA